MAKMLDTRPGIQGVPICPLFPYKLYSEQYIFTSLPSIVGPETGSEIF
jgi:hypothetical protein